MTVKNTAEIHTADKRTQHSFSKETVPQLFIMSIYLTAQKFTIYSFFTW